MKTHRGFICLESNFRGPRRQNGGLTIFSAVILLALLVLMLIYATRVQQSEQRISANEYRQKLAFEAAESAADQAIEYLLANNARVLSASPNAVPDGSGGTRPGWFDTTAGVWAACPDNPGADHPCGGEIPAGNMTSSFFYDDPGTTTTGKYDTIPINISMLPAETTAKVSAVLCQVDFTNPVGGCMAAPAATDNTLLSSFLITVLAYGYADCTDPTDTATCQVGASIAQPLTNYSIARGSPAVPLTARTTFPPTGTVEVVPNPNAGGIGVPVSVWANANESCSSGVATLGSGDWATCEYHEWYETDEIPEDMMCTQPSCSCAKSEAISYTVGTDDQMGIDMLEDPNFPCDLFEFFFGVPASEYQVVKSAARVVADCDSLDAESHGIYWVSGPQCRLDGTNVIGSPQLPVMLISAASNTTFTGTNNIFGVVFITDVEDPAATWDASGTNIVYGSVIIDAELDSFVGTFKAIYNGDVSLLAAGSSGIGTLSGGWRDFGLPVLSWE
jgi:type II secretory pathway pseudopilin PulG